MAGRHVPIPLVKAEQFTLLNLNFEHASYLRDPLDCLATYVSRAALEAIANEHCMPRIDALHIPPGVPVDDIVVRSLATSLLPTLQQPEQANRLFLDSVALALLTHLPHAYGEMPLQPQLKRGGLAP